MCSLLMYVFIRSLICFQFKTSTTRSTLQLVSDVWSFGCLMSREKNFRIFQNHPRKFSPKYFVGGEMQSACRRVPQCARCAYGALSMREGHTYIIIGPERDRSNPRKFSPRNSHFVPKRESFLPRKSIQYSQKV